MHDLNICLYHSFAVKSCEHELPKISHLLICYITGKFMLMLLCICMPIVHLSLNCMMVVV